MFGSKDNQEGGIKAQTFEISAKRGIGALQRKIRKWLAANPDVEIISTDFAGFGDNIGYVILFKGHEVIVPESHENDQLAAAPRLDAHFEEQQVAPQRQMQTAQSAGRIINPQFEQPVAAQRQNNRPVQPQQQTAPVFQTAVAQGGQPALQTAVSPDVPQSVEQQKPFRLGPGKTPTNRAVQQPVQPQRNQPQPQSVAQPVAQPQPVAHQPQPIGQQEEHLQSPTEQVAGGPRRSGFTTGAVFGNYDAFKPEE